MTPEQSKILIIVIVLGLVYYMWSQQGKKVGAGSDDIPSVLQSVPVDDPPVMELNQVDAPVNVREPELYPEFDQPTVRESVLNNAPVYEDDLPLYDVDRSVNTTPANMAVVDQTFAVQYDPQLSPVASFNDAYNLPTFRNTYSSDKSDYALSANDMPAFVSDDGLTTAFNPPSVGDSFNMDIFPAMEPRDIFIEAKPDDMNMGKRNLPGMCPESEAFFPAYTMPVANTTTTISTYDNLPMSDAVTAMYDGNPSALDYSAAYLSASA